MLQRFVKSLLLILFCIGIMQVDLFGQKAKTKIIRKNIFVDSTWLKSKPTSGTTKKTGTITTTMIAGGGTCQIFGDQNVNPGTGYIYNLYCDYPPEGAVYWYIVNGTGYDNFDGSVTAYWSSGASQGYMTAYDGNVELATIYVTINSVQPLSGGSITSSGSGICAGQSPGQISATVASNGSCGSYSYQWQSSPDNSNWSDISGATGQNYDPGALSSTAYFRRKVSCGSEVAYTGSIAFTVTSVPSPPGVYADSYFLCNSASTTLHATTGSNINWYNSAGSNIGSGASVVVAAADTYYATASNGCGSSGYSSPLSITTGSTPAAPVVSGSGGLLCDGGSTVLTASGSGTINWYYNGSYYSGSSSIYVNSAGVYYATASNSCGTSGNSNSVTISTSSTPGTPTVSAGATFLCDGSSTTLSASGAGTIYWYYNGSYYGSGANITVSGAGNYYAVASNSCGSSGPSTTITISTSNTPSAPVISAGTTFLCNGASTTLSASGGGTIYWYYNGTYYGSGSSISVSGEGNYYATAGNSCGTSIASNSISITNANTPAAPSISATNTFLCNGASATLSASGNGTIYWYYNGSYIGSGVSISVSSEGSYTATASNGCGTSTSSNVVYITTASTPAIPAISAGSTYLCNGNATSLTASGGGTIYWYYNGAYYGSGSSVSAAGAGYYYATASNSCGTSSTSSSITITTSATPGAPSISAGTTFLCNGASTTLSASGSGTINWYQNGVYYGSGTSITVSAAADYYANASNSCGTGANSTIISITTSATPAVPSISAGSTFLCNGASTTLTATGSGTINWYQNGAYYGSGTTIAVSVAGNYYATASNSCGSSAGSNSITITTSSTAAAPSISAGATLLCDGTSTTLTASGGNTINWYYNNGYYGSGSSISVSGAGNYYATATNSCGTSTGSNTLTITTSSTPSAPVIQASGSTQLCGSVTSVTINAVSGTGIAWSTGAGGNSIVVTAPGSYTATASNSCGVSVASAPVVVTTGSPPAVAPITVETGSASALCIGSTVVLNDLTAGGVWSTTDAAIASISGSTVTGVAVGSATINYTVTNSCGPTTVSIPVNVVTMPSVAAISGDPSVCAGATITLSDPTPGGTWSSANSSIASVSGSGIVTGQATGTTNILYSVTNSCGTSTVSHTVTVTTTPPVSSITPDFSLCIQGTQTITAGPATGGSWSSSNTAVATVNGSGLVTALAVGNASLVYTATNGCGSSSISTLVTVGTVPSVDPITVVSGNKDMLCVGADLVLANATVGGTWSSDNAGIATVVSGSTVRGMAGGSTNIIYTVSNTCGSTAVNLPVTVLGYPSVDPIAGNTSVCAGSSTMLSNNTAGGIWSSLNSSVASVDASGLVNGLAAGTATIQYIVSNGCTNTVRSFDITVTAKPVIASITGANTICYPDQSTLGNTTPGGLWSSSQTNVVSVDASGNLTPLASGTAVITYTVTDAAGCSDQVAKTITVYQKPIVASIAGPVSVCTGNTVILSSATAGGVWSSGSPSVASINTGGTVTGVSGGSAQIYYSVTSAEGCTTITSTALAVNEPPVVAPITGNASVCVNGFITLTDTTAGGVWSSSDPAVAEIGQSGIVNGLLAGNTQISYTVTSTSGCTSSAQFTLRVAEKVAEPLITGADIMVKGGSFQFSADTPGGTWGSSDTLVAKVDTSGMVNGLLGGVAQIRYTTGTVCGVQSAIKTLVVGSPGLTGTTNLPGAAVSGSIMTDLAPGQYPVNAKLNYIRTRSAVVPISDSAAFRVANYLQTVESTEFMDGIGRTIQSVMKQASPSGKDMIAPVVYDVFGREATKYLPYASEGNSGWFRSDAFAEQAASMSNLYPGEQVFYQKNVYEESPLNRVSKSMAAGNSWAGTGRGMSQAYLVNSTRDSVRIWDIASDTLTYLNEDSLTNIPRSDKGIYPSSVLFKLITVDDQGNTVQEFKDKDGRLLLKRVQLDSNAASGHSGWLNTYYVYDDLGLLRFVMPPKAVDQMAASQDWNPGSAANQGIVNALCFRYQYDRYKRMIAKKIPGAGWVYMVYDERDRLLFNQDANQRSRGQWMITIYDSLNRPVSTGMVTDNRTRGALQAQVNGIGYDPAYIALTHTYYDDYVFTTRGYQNTNNSLLDDGGNAYADTLPASASLLTRGIQTGLRLRVLGHPDSLSTGGWLETVSYYDEKARMIQSQADNYKNGVDIITQRYDFTGKPITTYHVHDNPGASQTLSIKTNHLYDVMGRLLSIKKKLNNNDSTVRYLTRNSFNEIGQLTNRQLGQRSYSDASEMELQQYAYTIRGWLKGINAQATGSIAGGGGSGTGPWFGMRLAYDSGYQQSQYNGNIAGIQWRSRGDGEQRSYGYGYDRANRLLFADFTQYTDNSWNTTAGLNFSSLLGTGITHTGAYDANGNILSMKQYGVKINNSSVIDDLQYHYLTGSNKLQNVVDAQNDPQTRLGDFRSSSAYLTLLGTKTSAAVDYTYDDNGNLLKDLNKDIGTSSGHGIAYNYLNLPYQVSVAGKGIIQYIYDAAGNKLSKKTVQTDSVTKTTQTDYISGAVYLNDTLQYLGHEEGRIRRKVGGGWVYDYFVKDHLGNTRMVLSEEEQLDAYPAATMELSQASVETALYSNVEETRSAKPAGYPADTYTDPNNYVAKLNGNGNKVGPGIVLKVMSGDRVNIRASSWYYLNGADPGTPVNPLNDLLNVLATGVSTVVTDFGKFTRTDLISNGILSPGVGSMLDQQTASYSNSTKPKAYLSWILLDEQFRLVSSSSGFEQVGADGELKTWVKTNLPINRNGYLYVYTSNESPVDVFFDNLQVSHIRGPLLEETHYYPFGLTMAGISSKAAGKLENRYKYNGIELDEDLGLNAYEAHYRILDPAIGRWWQIDPQTDNTLQEFSPYASMRNNPILRSDPLGDLDNYTIKETGEIQREVTADKTDNFKYVKNDGTTTDLGTFEKNYKGLDKVPKEGTNFKNYTKSGKDFVEGFTLAAVLGAAYEFKKETGLDIQINQLNGSDGGHSSHKGDGQFADIRYVNKNGNVDQGSVWTDNSLGLNNYDVAKSQMLVDKFQKFGFKDSPGRVSMLTENSKGNAPALSGTYFPGHGKAPNNFHHRHHIHLQHNVNFLKNKKP